MREPYAARRKIDPSRGARLGDGSPNDNDRVEIGPTQLHLAEWQAAGLALPDLAAMRDFRWRRLTQAIIARDYGGILMFDPLNIRYATDTTNMQLWNSHNPFLYTPSRRRKCLSDIAFRLSADFLPHGGCISNRYRD